MPAVHVDAEQLREAARRAASENTPLSPDRPPVNAKGEVDMGSQRCVADTKRGGQCRAHTRHGEYCWVHLAQRHGARIKPSGIAGAGKGLFAARDYEPGEVAARYTGDLVPTAQGAERDGFGGSHYVLQLSEQVSLDAARTNTAEGRMVNDARGSGARNNCRFSINQRNKTAVLRTTRRVRKGEEFYVAYGQEFWLQGQAVKAGRAQPVGHKEAPAPAGTRADPIVLAVVQEEKWTTVDRRGKPVRNRAGDGACRHGTLEEDACRHKDPRCKEGKCNKGDARQVCKTGA